MFNTLSDTNLSSLCYSLKEEVYNINQYVYKQGSCSPDTLYMVKEGEFKTVTNMPLAKVDKKVR